MHLTAIAFDNGRDFAFYRDVYERDAALSKALNAPLSYVPPKGMPDFGAVVDRAVTLTRQQVDYDAVSSSDSASARIAP